MSATFTIDHKCGHQQERDLSHKLPEERESFANWLKGTDCFDCYRAKNDKPLTEADKKRWVAKQREAELREAADDQVRYNLPILQGSDKQQSWATRIRYEKIRDAYLDLVVEGELDDEEFDTDFVEPLRLIQSAKWWIEQKDVPFSDLPQIVEALKLDPSSDINENPY